VAWFGGRRPAERRPRPPPGRELPPFIVGPPPQPSVLARLLGVDRLSDDADLARSASPAHLAAGATAPFLLIHGDADGLVGEDQSRRMHAALTEAGARLGRC